MALKDLLLHIDHSPGYPARLELAINLARTHNACLKGIYVLSHSYFAPRYGAGTAEAAHNAAEFFAERTTMAGISTQWIYVDSNVVGVSVEELLSPYTYYTDLLIVGQGDPVTFERDTSFSHPERLGLGAGCPLLVVPNNGAYTMTGSQVMIAWKPGRGVSSSVKGAMPILEKAQQVRIVTIGSDGDDIAHANDNVHDICSYLALHHVQAKSEQIIASSDITVGDLLLNHACEQNIDLLVMGAYSQSRRGGYVISPVVKHLMSYMTVPLMFSG